MATHLYISFRHVVAQALGLPAPAVVDKWTLTERPNTHVFTPAIPGATKMQLTPCRTGVSDVYFTIYEGYPTNLDAEDKRDEE